MDKLCKFRMGQHVKVQVFHIITTGTVVGRKVIENSRGVFVRYDVQFSEKTIDIVEPWEDNLIEAQTLPLGEIL
jgi:hypothetical protein